MARIPDIRRHWRTFLSWPYLLGATLAGIGIVQGASLWIGAVTPDMLATGQALFEHEWQPNDPLAGEGDGLGPVFNAKSCVACHFQGGVGGAGPNKHNVTSFEAHPTLDRPNVVSGVIHAFALAPDAKETPASVHELFPIVKGGKKVIGGCTVTFHDFDPVQVHSINTPALFGAGAIDVLSDGALSRHVTWRTLGGIKKELQLDFTGTSPGRLRVLPDGRVGKFGWKAQFATLEEFVAAACAVEVGLTNPLHKQHEPKRHVEDPDAKLDINQQQLDALVAYIAHLPEPRTVWPSDPAELATAKHGEKVFTEVGCADCHTPNIAGLEGVYSDFCLHQIQDPEGGSTYGREELPVPLPSDHPLPDEWKTPPLWGVADTAPYLHDGSAPTLADAIERHGAHARHSREKYRNLNGADKDALIAFLNTLRCPGPTEEPESPYLPKVDEVRLVQAE